MRWLKTPPQTPGVLFSTSPPVMKLNLTEQLCEPSHFPQFHRSPSAVDQENTSHNSSYSTVSAPQEQQNILAEWGPLHLKVRYSVKSIRYSCLRSLIISIQESCYVTLIFKLLGICVYTTNFLVYSEHT